MNVTRNTARPATTAWGVENHWGVNAKAAGHAGESWLKPARRWAGLAVVLCVAAKAWIAFTRYLNQDEFESLHQGWLIYSGATPYRDFNSNHPPLAFEFLGWLNYWTSDALTLITLSRSVTLVLSLVSLYLVYQISRSIYGPLAGYLSVLVLALNATFWEWSLEVRTDSFMVPLWLLAVTLLFSSRPQSTNWRLVLIGVFSGAAFWVNQKAVCHALPIGIFMLAGGPRGTWRLKHVGLAVAASLIPTAYVIVNSWLNGSWSELWAHNFSGAWELVHDSPYQDDRVVTIRMNAERDPGFWVLATLAMLGAWRQGWERKHVFVIGTCVWMAVTLFLTPGPFPYYMISILPMFAVAIGGWGAWVLQRVDGATMSQRWKSWAAASLVLLFVIPPALRLAHLGRPTMSPQRTIVDVGSQLLKPGETVFDGAGILMNRPDAYPFHWVLWISEREKLAAGELPPLLQTLKSNSCRLVIDNFRTTSLPAQERRALEQQFVRAWGPIRVPGYDSHEKIGSDSVSFQLWYPGAYRANRDDLIVNGKPFRQGTQLAAGTHTMAVAGDPGRVVLTENSRLSDVDLPEDQPRFREVWGEYGFRY